MTEGGPAVYGTVTGIEAGGALLVELENGEYGVSAAEETVRTAAPQRGYPARMIGRRMGFIAGARRGDGRIELSARKYEEAEHQRICDDFRENRRNVYDAQLVSTTADGKLAFYRLAQGVTGALHVSQFSLCRLYSFLEIQMPGKLTVAITGIDSRGWLSLSSKIAFGDFEYSVEKLELSEGADAEGIVSNIMPDGAVSVMLAPNLTVLTDPNIKVGIGERVKLRCRRIDRNLHRIKAMMLEKLGTAENSFPYSRWVRPAAELDRWIDMAEFDRRIRPIRVSREPKENVPARQENVDFRISATRSPFSTFENERVVRDPQRAARLQDIRFEVRMGYLNDRHMQVAGVIEELKYSSAWQIRRYLYLAKGMAVTERELKNVVDRLIKHDIAAVLRFQSNEGNLLTRVLYPSSNWKNYCGRLPRDFGPRDCIEADASLVKTRLAANQLLIGQLRTGGIVEALDTHPFLKNAAGDVRVRPRHMIRQGGRTRYLEAVRVGWEKEILDKLKRYDLLLGTDSDSEIVLVMEESGHVAPMEARVSALNLKIKVRLTDDLSCLGTADEI